MAVGAAKLKPLRPIIPKRLLEDRIVVAEPEFSFPTDANSTVDLRDEPPTLRYDPRIHVDCIKQWVNETRPAKRVAFERVSTAALSDTLSPHYVSGLQSIDGDEQPASDSSLEEEWRKREFDRAFGRLQTDLGFDLDKNCESRKIAQKVARYRKAFLRGFFEARVRRLQANKCLYDKLHVNADFVRQKYRQLVHYCQPCYVPEEQQREWPQAVDEIGQQDGNNDNEEEKSTSERTADAAEISSVYSFVPERDNVMLQDVNEAPHLRGYGRCDKRDKFDSKVRLLHLSGWISPDIREWMAERKQRERLEGDEDEQRTERQEMAGMAADGAAQSQNGGGFVAAKNAAGVNDWKYEQIRGANELTNWLGPKLLNQQKERDLENFMKGGSLMDEVTSAVAVRDDGKDAPVAPPVALADNRASDASEDSKTAVSETPSQYLTKELIESQSKEYYKLWYSTHDTYNTTPFLEGRLQRLMKEVLGRRQWSMYSSYLKERSEDKMKQRVDSVDLNTD